MTRQIKTVLIAVGSFGATAALLVPEFAVAQYVNQSAISCKPYVLSGYDLDPEEGEYVATTGQGTNLLCPLLDDDEHPHDSVDQVQVFFHDTSTMFSATAEVCVNPWNAIGASCGGAVASSSGATTGYLQLTVTDVSMLANHPDDFAYLHVGVPSGNSAQSSVSGFSVLY
jgi:hypothetical protein